MEITLISLEDLIKENDRLKHENQELRISCSLDKTWASIREGTIFPKLKEIGYPELIMQTILTPISQIVRSYLDINKMSEINHENYDIAKQISTDILDSLSKHQSKGALKWTKYYKEMGFKPKY